MTLLDTLIAYVHAHPVVMGALPSLGGLLYAVMLVGTAIAGNYTDAQMAELKLTRPRVWGIKKALKILLPFAGELLWCGYAIVTDRTPPDPPPPPDPPTQKDAAKQPPPSYCGMARIAIGLTALALFVSGCAVGKAACNPVVLDAERAACGLILEGEHLSADDLREARQKAAMRRLGAMPASSASASPAGSRLCSAGASRSPTAGTATSR